MPGAQTFEDDARLGIGLEDGGKSLQRLLAFAFFPQRERFPFLSFFQMLRVEIPFKRIPARSGRHLSQLFQKTMPLRHVAAIVGKQIRFG